MSSVGSDRTEAHLVIELTEIHGNKIAKVAENVKTAVFVRNLHYLSNAIDFLHKETRVLYVVYADKDQNGFLQEYCGKLRVECLSQSSFAELLRESKLEALDLIISYYYQQRLSREILSYPNRGSINFHPAPLPKYRGVGNYSKCLLDDLDYWGVSAHFMDEEYDNGPLIRVLRFHISPRSETYLSLEKKTRIFMFELLVQVLGLVRENCWNHSTYRKEPYHYLSRKDIQELKEVTLEDSQTEIDKKIRAFWCPPFHGANINIGGKRYTLINDEILNELARLYQNK